jgi:Ca2+-binding RTX toxin-like protein
LANYALYGNSVPLFEAWGASNFSSARLYSTSTELGLLNPDGSKTYLIGSGLVWDSATGRLTAGTITQISHYTPAGTFIDSMSGLSLNAASVQATFDQSGANAEALRQFFFAGNDVFDARYRVDGLALPSKLIGYGGNDLMMGGAGANEFWGYAGLDTLNGGSGADFLNGGGDADTINGNVGQDRIIGDGGADSLNGGAGNDGFYAGAGNDSVNGGADTDTAVYYRSFFDLIITKTSIGFQVIEPNGIDSLTNVEFIAADEGTFAFNTSTNTWSLVDTNPGVFLIEPGNRQVGTEADDTIALRWGSNLLGLGGNDSLTGTNGWDMLKGGDGNDTVSGEASAFSASAGQDRIYGDDGDDQLFGMGGTDLIYGGAGNDTIAGGRGNDTLTGGAGNDVFVFRYATESTTVEAWNNDIINDFQLGTDRIRLDFGPWGTAGTPTNLTPTLTLTANGWLLSLPDAGSVLLKGVTTPGLTLADVLL